LRLYIAVGFLLAHGFSVGESASTFAVNMRVLLDGSGVSIDEKRLGARMSASAVISIVGPALSNREIPMSAVDSN